MNATSIRDVVIGRPVDDQELLPLASEGVHRWIWHSRFGEILIEVCGDEVAVNGCKVRPHEP